MKHVDHILTNAMVITMDEEFRMFDPGAVAVQGDEIVAVGEADEILEKYQAEEVLDCAGRTLMPGLINAHTHAPMTLLRGLTDDQRLDVWLLGYMMPVEREFVSPEFCKLGTKIACAEMIRGGITAFADMYYHEDTIAETVASVGMRAICCQTVLKFPSPDAESYEDALISARALIETWKDHELVMPGVAPHSAYTTTEEILKECADLAMEYDVLLHIHIAETAQEQEQWREIHDMPVVPWLKKHDVFEGKTIAAHCVHIDEGEIHTLEHAHTGVSHNPSSNLKLSSGFAPVEQMLKAGLNVGIGTDGPASNNDLDMFEEMRLASFIAKATTGDPTALPAKTTLAMGTILGAKALHIDHLTGSIEVGKKADLTLINLESLHSLPHFHRDPESIYSRIVYSAKASDVTDVMVNGAWLMRDKKLETIEEAPLMEAAGEFARRIDAFLVQREGSVLSKLIAIGEATQEESYEVQIKVRLPDPSGAVAILDSGKLDIVRTAHYLEYDTYFSFSDRSQGRLRYREDEFVNQKGDVYNVRYRLTLTGPVAERAYPNYVLLSRSRFIAPATHSLRFYREYFNPEAETEINKDRLRWLVRFKDEEFFINVDQILKPEYEGCFLEVKSRTWSRRDAERKSDLISELIAELGINDPVPVQMEYPDLVAEI